MLLKPPLPSSNDRKSIANTLKGSVVSKESIGAAAGEDVLRLYTCRNLQCSALHHVSYRAKRNVSEQFPWYGLYLHDQVHCVFLAVLVVGWLQVALAGNVGFLPRQDTSLESHRE